MEYQLVQQNETKFDIDNIVNKQICVNKSLNDLENSLNSEPNLCGICLELLNDNNNDITILKCEHKLHTKCYEELMKEHFTVIKRCPYCRKNLNDNVVALCNCWCGSYTVNKQFDEVLNIVIKIFKFLVILMLISLIIFVIMVFLMQQNKSNESITYCDNDIVQCDYFKTHGIVSNNSEISTDSILYIYDYNNNNNNYSCYYRENYILPYKKICELLKEKIGKQIQIFVNKKNTENCILNYANYNVELTKYDYYINYIITIFAILSICILCMAFYIDHLKKINHK